MPREFMRRYADFWIGFDEFVFVSVDGVMRIKYQVVFVFVAVVDRYDIWIFFVKEADVYDFAQVKNRFDYFFIPDFPVGMTHSHIIPFANMGLLASHAMHALVIARIAHIFLPTIAARLL
jgi:hypothetical protein